MPRGHDGHWVLAPARAWLSGDRRRTEIYRGLKPVGLSQAVPGTSPAEAMQWPGAARWQSWAATGGKAPHVGRCSGPTDGVEWGVTSLAFADGQRRLSARPIRVRDEAHALSFRVALDVAPAAVATTLQTSLPFSAAVSRLSDARA